MNLWVGAAGVAVSGTLLASGVAVATPQPSASDRAPQSYTFRLGVDMAMRTFPWLHFRLEGLGDYRRGDHYVVHITKKPSFAEKVQDIDLSMIDPSMWQHRYRYRITGQQDGDTIFALESLTKKSTLTSATVAMNPVSGAHWVDVSYSDGTHVHMVITSNAVSGFLLPTTMIADVNYPHMFPLSADASFTDYSFTEPVQQLQPQDLPTRPADSSGRPPRGPTHADRTDTPSYR